MTQGVNVHKFHNIKYNVGKFPRYKREYPHYTRNWNRLILKCIIRVPCYMGDYFYIHMYKCVTYPLNLLCIVYNVPACWTIVSEQKTHWNQLN